LTFDGGDYSVAVRARAGASGQWSAWGPECTIEINGAGPIAPPTDDVSLIKVIEDSQIAVNIYPNPSDGLQVAINLSELTDTNQKIVIEVVDFTGKVVHTDQVANKGAEANFIVDFETKLASGMYFVNLYVNDVKLVEKLTVE
jgi:hypothetical protein